MANIKISALTTYTGSATDIRWFVMNNSGNTETTKFSGYSSQLIPGPGTNSYRTINSGAANVNNPSDDIIIGNNATTTGGSGGIAIGKNATAGGIIRKAVAIGQDVSANGTGIIVGWNGNANGDGACTLGILNAATQESSVAVGVLVTTSGIHAVGIGRDVTSSGTRSVAIGRGASVSRENSTSVGGNSNTIDNGTVQSIFGGTSNTISSSNNRNTIINGTSCQITGTSSGATYIGLNSYTNANINDCTYVDNLQILRTPSTLVQSEVSGTSVTVNLNNGGFSQLYISANTTVDITNVRDGQSFSIKTRTNGNYTTTWTATGYTFQFEGGNNQPGNTVTDIFDFQVFGTVIYGSRKHNYS